MQYGQAARYNPKYQCTAIRIDEKPWLARLAIALEDSKVVNSTILGVLYPQREYVITTDVFTWLDTLSPDEAATYINECLDVAGHDACAYPLVGRLAPGERTVYRLATAQESVIMDFKTMIFHLRARNLLSEQHTKALIALANFYPNL